MTNFVDVTPSSPMVAGATDGLTVVILTHDEALHIGRAIRSVSGFATRVVIVDSGSTDGTIDIARESGADVYHNRFVNYAMQSQWALEQTGIDTRWTMRLDADEVIEPDLAAKLPALLAGLLEDVTGVALPRKHIFMGRWIRHGGRYPLWLVRIFRTGCGHVEQRWMDEHVVLSHGRSVQIDGGFADINLKDAGFFTAKHNGYAVREALDALTRQYGLDTDSGQREDLVGQAARKRQVKNRFYNRLPFGCGPLAYFLYRYFIQLGFLDGRAGLVYHGLQGLWYRFLVDVRKWEFERALAGCTTNAERLAVLSQVTGYSRDTILQMARSAPDTTA